MIWPPRRPERTSFCGNTGGEVIGTDTDVPCGYPGEAYAMHRCHKVACKLRGDRECVPDAARPCEERTVESVWFDVGQGEHEAFICATHMKNAEANHVLTYLGGLVRSATGLWELRPGAIRTDR